MGTVYEGESTTTTNVRVAIKVLKPDQATRSDSVSRFEREGRVLSAIRHPNICQIYDLGRLPDGCPFMVMERLTGETLAHRIERERNVEPSQLVRIVRAALQALDAAHRQNVVHRDFKPDNIFIGTGSSSAVKVLDFGISKDTGLQDAGAHLTRTGMVMGTPYYMAPEQAMGDRNLDARVDVWAAGVVLYEGLSGRRPFVAKNYNSLLVQILTTAPIPIDQVVSHLPRSLVHAVSRAMEKKRELRLQSVAELSELLGAVTWPAAAPHVALSSFARTARAEEPVNIRQRRRQSAVDLRPQAPAEDGIEEEPTTVLQKKIDIEDTPLIEDQEATQVDPPRFFEAESTNGRDRGSR